MSERTELLKDLIEASAEAAAQRVARELSSQISKAYERLGIIEQRVGIGTNNGLVGEFRQFKIERDVKYADCETKFHAVRHLAASQGEPVKRWKWMLAGAGGLVVGAGTIVELLKAMHLLK
jgi:hypothetical protein